MEIIAVITAGMVVFGTVALVICLGLLASLERAWVATKLWAWFVMPMFAVPAITVWQMFGIAMLASMIVPTPYKKVNAEEANTWEGLSAFGHLFVSPLFVLLVAYIVRFYCLAK